LNKTKNNINEKKNKLFSIIKSKTNQTAGGNKISGSNYIDDNLQNATEKANEAIEKANEAFNIIKNILLYKKIKIIYNNTTKDVLENINYDFKNTTTGTSTDALNKSKEALEYAKKAKEAKETQSITEKKEFKKNFENYTNNINTIIRFNNDVNRIKINIDNTVNKTLKKLKNLKEHLLDEDINEAVDTIKKIIPTLQEIIKNIETKKNNKGGSVDQLTSNSDDYTGKIKDILNKVNIVIDKQTKINNLTENIGKAKELADKMNATKNEKIKELNKNIPLLKRLPFMSGGDIDKFINDTAIETKKSNTNDDYNKILEDINSKIELNKTELILFEKEIIADIDEINKLIDDLDMLRNKQIEAAIKSVNDFMLTLEDLMFQYNPLRFNFYQLFNENPETRNRIRALKRALILLEAKSQQEIEEDKRMIFNILQILNSSTDIDNSILKINRIIGNDKGIKLIKEGGENIYEEDRDTTTLMNGGTTEIINNETSKKLTAEIDNDINKLINTINIFKEINKFYIDYTNTDKPKNTTDPENNDSNDLLNNNKENFTTYFDNNINTIIIELEKLYNSYINKTEPYKNQKRLSINIEEYKETYEETIKKLKEALDNKEGGAGDNKEEKLLTNIQNNLDELLAITESTKKLLIEMNDVALSLVRGEEESIFNKLYNSYMKDKGTNESAATEKLLIRLENNELVPNKVLKVTLRDKVVFIFASLFIRLFTLSILENMIEKGTVKNSKFAILAYLGLFTIIYIAFVSFVNLDIYRLRIVFNYINFNANASNAFTFLILLWVFGGVIYYITYHINKDLPITNTTDESKVRLIYRIQVISLITWLFLVLMILIM
jgi:hypothetical protein